MSTVIDARGENCPEPVIRVAQALQEASAGDVLQVLTDVEECVRYIKDLVKVTGIGRVEVTEKEGHYCVVIRVTG